MSSRVVVGIQFVWHRMMLLQKRKRCLPQPNPTPNQKNPMSPRLYGHAYLNMLPLYTPRQRTPHPPTAPQPTSLHPVSVSSSWWSRTLVTSSWCGYTSPRKAAREACGSHSFRHSWRFLTAEPFSQAPWSDIRNHTNNVLNVRESHKCPARLSKIPPPLVLFSVLVQSPQFSFSSLYHIPLVMEGSRRFGKGGTGGSRTPRTHVQPKKNEKKMEILRTMMGGDCTPGNPHLRGVLYLNRHEQVEKTKIKPLLWGIFEIHAPRKTTHTWKSRTLTNMNR